MNCQECRNYFYGYLQNAEDVPAGVVTHMENCVTCREQVARLRRQLNVSETQQHQYALLRKHLRLHACLLDQWVSCSSVRPFLPALLMEGMQITVQTPVTAHLEHCSRCRQHLGSIRSLGLSPEQLVAAGAFMSAADETGALPEKAGPVLKAILQSEHSDIETNMNSRGSSGVKVRYRTAGMQHRSRSVRYLLTGSLAVAAVFFVITLLPTAAVGNLENVNRAVKSVSEVHLERYSEKDDLIQEIWMSKSLGFKIYKQPQKTFIKNMRSGQILQMTPGTDAMLLSEGLRDDDVYARLLPFDQLKDLPPQYEWTFVQDSVYQGKDVYIYELTWQTPGIGVTVYKKWRAALDTRTYLPYRIEWFEKIGSEQEFILLTRSEVQYPSKSQFLKLLEAEGFQRFLTGDHME